MSRADSLGARIGVLGDVHCEDLALSAARSLFTKHAASRVLAVGDFVDGPGDPHRTLELLADTDAVAGNHDRWYRQGMLRELPDALPVRYRFVVSGHSHRRMVRRISRTTFINAGTLLRGFDPCVLILDLDRMTAVFFDWNGVAYVTGPTIEVP